ncbi:MAG: YgjP-like metallopeptidase domain-containing protein [Desulfuromonadaceae bacterium]
MAAVKLQHGCLIITVPGGGTNAHLVRNHWYKQRAYKKLNYEVVHEHYHLLQHNHSKAYWREVERVMPDYRACREWFKLNGSGLQV